MERYARIVEGTVVNVTTLDPLNIPDGFQDWVASGRADIGWSYDGSAFAPPAPPDQLDLWRASAVLSRRNFCIACFRAGLLSADDAVIAAKGEWPAAFDKALTGMAADRVTEAKIEWAAVTEIRRNAPLLKAVQAVTRVTDGQIDALFGWSEK